MKKIVCVLSVILLASSIFAAVDRIWTNGSGDRDFNRGSNWFDVVDSYVFTSNDRANISMGGADAPILSSNATRNNLMLGNVVGSTGEVYITGGTNSFAGGIFAYVADTTGIVHVSGGTTSFSSYFTVGYTGQGLFELSDGVMTVNRSQICQNVGSRGEYNISGGEMNIVTFLTVGSTGQGYLNVSGGTLNVQGGILKLGDVSKAAQGIANLSGEAVINVLTNTVIIGEEGYGLFNINGGTLNCPSISIGYLDDPNSQGYINLTDGTINTNTYITIGSNGIGQVDVSGGAINANRMLVGQGAIGETYPTNGSLTVSGGELNLVNFLEIGRDSTGKLTLYGDAGKINLAAFEINGLSTAQFVLNGAGGVGNGLAMFAGTEMDGEELVVNQGRLLFKEGSTIDADFITGTSVAGDYVVMASSERAAYLPAAETDESLAADLAAGDMSDILSMTAQSAGWSLTNYDAGSGSAVVLTSPVTASEVAWASAGTNDVAVVDNDSVTLSSAKTTNGAIIGDMASGSLAVSTGADASFVNLTIGADAGASGSVTVTDGSVAVESLAYVGKEGAASLDVSGGSFSALNLVAATGQQATADITVSGDASFEIGNMLALTKGSNMTLSGYQTTVNVANLTLDDFAKLTFELDATNGVGNGIVVSGNVVLNGAIYINNLNDRVDTTYTLIRTSGTIFDNTNDLVDTPFVNYEIVENGDYQELQVTLFSPTSCEDVIENGFALASDVNEDCKVNMEDIAFMATEWLKCNDPTLPECNWLQ